jgi:outer membrane protein assembly factor BamB
MEGNPLWERRIESRDMRHGWGTAASPVLHADRLYYVNDNDQESYLLCLDASTGEELWRVPRDEKSNWATPYVWENELRTEIVTAGTGQVRSYDLSGEILWTLTGMSSITIGTPYAAEGLLYVTSGYVLDPLRPIYAIRPGAEGDITLAEDQTSNEFIVWADRQAAPYNPTTLVYEGRLYALLDRGFLTCHNARDGTEIYGKQRIPDGRAFTASPWAAGDRIYGLNEDGVTFVFQAGDEYKLLATNPLAEDDMTLATPAIAGDRLLIRTGGRLYCVREE